MPRPTPRPRDAGRWLLLLGSSSSGAAVPLPCPSLSPGKLRTRHNAPPLSPPSRAPRRQSARCRVSGETWLSCAAASVHLWTVRAFGRPVQAWGSLLSGQRREEWRRASPQCEWAVNVNGVARSFWKPESLSSAENPKSRVPSLVVGLFFGSLAGLGSYQLSQDPKNVWLFLAATSGTFASVMALRSYYHGKVMPVGLIAGASWAILPSPLHSFLGDGPSVQLFHLQRQVQPSQF
ncbi:uncharacterized protein LOC116531270 isoform X2 [Sapajus apella]|uniref:Uncharacterized protein LOC116531270 isoform X2 n=1 Tax=Sapajus apella TaxID=9515 RepID=A0A6J3FJM6_SAPAP|nr:uncharacterized protein LOC116531270 isoform X2 [Sapajus apella]